MEKTEGGKEHDSGISEAIGSPPIGQGQMDPAHGKVGSFTGSQRSDSPPRSGAAAAIAVGENKSPSPPHSSTTTLTTTGSSSGPSVVGVGAVNPNSGNMGETGAPTIIPGHQGFGAPQLPGDPRLLGLPSMEQMEHSPGRQRPIQLYEGRYNPSRYPVAIKLLVSNNVAGSIIGRQGQTISELQTRSMTRIKLSQTGDYFPGTHDRVCLIQGEPGNVKNALRLLLERMYLLHEQECSQQATWQMQKQAEGFMQPFNFVVRLLVPSSSCGMIIGKAGSNIKFLEESSGVVSVRLSPKDAPDPSSPVQGMVGTTERVVSITGTNMECCLQCTYMVFEGMISHPDVSRYTNMTTTYSRKTPAADAALDPNLNVPQPPPMHSPPAPYDPSMGLAQGGYVPSPKLAGPRRVLSSPDMGQTELQYNQEGAVDSSANVDLASSTTPAFPAAPASDRPSYHFAGAHGAPGAEGLEFPGTGGPGIPHSVSAPDLLAFQLDQSLQFSPHESNKSNQMVPVAPTCLGPNAFQAQVAVPDSMIGSILGRGGRTLNELQLMSGTRIWISQRGEYVPGTRNRIVTVRGATAQSVWQAQMLISQRVALPPTAGQAEPEQQS